MRNLLRGLETRLKRLEGQRTAKKSSWWDQLMEQPLPPEASVSQVEEVLFEARQLVDDALAKSLLVKPVIGLKELAAPARSPPVDRLECVPLRNGDGHE